MPDGNGVARADLRGQRVGPIERTQDGTLERHGNGETLEIERARKPQKIRQLAGLAGQERGVHMLGLEGRAYEAEMTARRNAQLDGDWVLPASEPTAPLLREGK